MKTPSPLSLRLLAVAALLAGLCLGVWLYIGAPQGDEADGSGVGFVIEGGQMRPVRAEDSRSYRRGLEYMGGKSAVLAEELREQAADLWRGGGAALLAGALGLGVCALLWRAADRAEGRAEGRATDTSAGRAADPAEKKSRQH